MRKGRNKTKKEAGISQFKQKISILNGPLGYHFKITEKIYSMLKLCSIKKFVRCENDHKSFLINFLSESLFCDSHGYCLPVVASL